MRLKHLLFLICLAWTVPVAAQEEDELDYLLDLAPVEPESAVPESEVAVPETKTALPEPDPLDDELDSLLPLEEVPAEETADPVNDRLELVSVAPEDASTELPVADAAVASDGVTDSAPAPDSAEKAKKEKAPKKPKVKKEKESRQKAGKPARERNGSDKIHNLSVMASANFLIDTGNVGRTSPLLTVSVGARPQGKRLLVAGEVGWGFFGATVPVYNADDYKLKINMLTVGAKAGYWFMAMDKISPFVTGTLSMAFGFGELAARPDFAMSAALDIRAGVSIPVGYFCIMPHLGYWVSGFNGAASRHIQLNGIFLGVTVQFTP